MATANDSNDVSPETPEHLKMLDKLDKLDKAIEGVYRLEAMVGVLSAAGDCERIHGGDVARFAKIMQSILAETGELLDDVAFASRGGAT